MSDLTPVQVLQRVSCWWRGHEPHPQDPSPPEALSCMHCGGWVSYGDMVGDTRQNAFKNWARYWLFRRWFPKKCSMCGRRRGHSLECDDIPF